MVIKSDRPMKIRLPVHRSGSAEIRGAEEESFEKYTRLLKEPTK
jgi:hypothetical protein